MPSSRPVRPNGSRAGTRAASKVAVASRPARGRGGKPARRSRAAAEVRSLRERLRHLVSASPTILYACKPGGDFAATYVSENVLAQTGYPAEAFIADPTFWARHVHPDDLPIVAAEVSQLPKVGRHAIEYRFLHKDGSYRWMYDELRLARDAAGRAHEIVGTWTDVTERKQAELALIKARDALEQRVAERTAELRAEHNFIAAILDTAPALVVVLDRERRVMRFNKACEEASGRSFAEVRGRPLADLQLIPPGEGAEAQAVFDALVSGRFASPHENHWQRPDGTQRLIAWRSTRVVDKSGAVQYVIGTGSDVTEQRQAEARAREHLDEVARMHRLHTMGEIAGLIAHQLNQPLAAISAYAEANMAARRRGESDPSVFNRNLSHIMEQAQRASRSIRELRAFLARGHGEREQANLAQIVQSACRLIDTEARARNVCISIEPTAAALPLLSMEVLQVEQVLVNLLQNAVEAMQGVDLPEREVNVKIARDGNAAVRVTVADNGPGFDAVTAQRIFEPLYTTKRDGIGMGLSISRSIVEAHGGRIWAVAGRGGTIHFTLPLGS